MKKLFNNLLVPVDFSRNTEPAMREAIELANQFECNIHVLYVEPSKSILPFFDDGVPRSGKNDRAAAQAENKMMELRKQFRFDLQPPLSMHTAVQSGNVESAIVFYSIKNQIDLVIFSKVRKSFFNGWFRDVNINRLSKKIRCPLLTVQTEVNLDRVTNIVLPVGEFLPVRKLMFATYLAKKYKSKLHLIATVQQVHGHESAPNIHLVKAYKLIRDNIEVQVECRTFAEGNIADLTLQYAKNVNADLIVVNPGQESVLSGFTNRLFSRFIATRSRIPVMTIASVKN
ncbi:MAG: universal stress protein [Gemmatimonadaceae bacterium]|nr:universal stress protein [Chitinophagaceae bacterium]